MAIPQEVLAYGWIPFTVVVVVSMSYVLSHDIGLCGSLKFCALVTYLFATSGKRNQLQLNFSVFRIAV